MISRMKQVSLSLMVFGYTLTTNAASAVTAPSPTAGFMKMMIGLAAVLLVLAVISWGMKKYMGSHPGKNSVISVVGGVSVGSRERVMVLEVADRWLVVGVSAGNVSSLANLEAGDQALSEQITTPSKPSANRMSPDAFSQWLKASTKKLNESNNDQA
jgi:flagellar protein FliO/FliZ